nr:uncharacterized protein LOC129042293 [Pongo pygmaeus]
MVPWVVEEHRKAEAGPHSTADPAAQAQRTKQPPRPPPREPPPPGAVTGGSLHFQEPPPLGAATAGSRHRQESPRPPGAVTVGNLHLLEPPPLGAATSGAAAALGPAGPPRTPRRRLCRCPRPGRGRGSPRRRRDRRDLLALSALKGRGAGRRSGGESWSSRERAGQARWVSALALRQRPWDPRSVAVEGAESDPGRGRRSS